MLQVAGTQVRVAPKLLFTLDRPATTKAALDAGRGSWAAAPTSLLAPLTRDDDVAPVLGERPTPRERLAALLAPLRAPAGLRDRVGCAD